MIYSFDTRRFGQFALAVLASALLASQTAQAAAPRNAGITTGASQIESKIAARVPAERQAGHTRAKLDYARQERSIRVAGKGDIGLILGVGY
jgi:hypothetical protein